MGVRCYLNASAGKIVIGRGVAIAPYTQIYSCSHHPVPGKPVMDGFKVADVVIEDDVLIGGGSIIVPGIHIGQGAVVATAR